MKLLRQLRSYGDGLPYISLYVYTCSIVTILNKPLGMKYRALLNPSVINRRTEMNKLKTVS
jgi:hypothetical protein